METVEYYAPPYELRFEDQHTTIGIPNDVRHLGISASGGLDSSLVLFYLCKYITEHNLEDTVKIFPLTGIDKRRPTNKFDVEDIINLMRDKFPGVRFAEGSYWDNTREWINGHLWTKVDKDRVKLKEVAIQNQLQMIANGRTSNPPMSVIESFGTEFEEERSHDRTRKTLYHPDNPEDPRYKAFWWYRPWENCDKKFVGHFYKENNLIDDLYPLTWSCVEYAIKTKYFTEPCGECYWCKEKEWGFGTYR